MSHVTLSLFFFGTLLLGSGFARWIGKKATSLSSDEDVLALTTLVDPCVYDERLSEAEVLGASSFMKSSTELKLDNRLVDGFLFLGSLEGNFTDDWSCVGEAAAREDIIGIFDSRLWSILLFMNSRDCFINSLSGM